MMKKITLLFLLLIGSITTSFGQLSQNFETWPLTDWTIQSTNTTNTWEEAISGNGGIVGNGAEVLYDFGQDESLISPVFTVPSGTPSLKFKVSLSYYWSVTPYNNYDVTASISTDGGTTWTPLWSEADLGVFTNYTPYDINIPLTAYAGQTNAQIKFQYVGDDGAALYLDEVSVDVPPTTVPSCATGIVSTPNATCGNFASSISWGATPTATGYNLTVGTTSGGTDLVNNVDVGNVLTYNLPTQTPGTTYYWTVVPYNVVGPATGCTENSYTTFATGCFCTSLPTSNDGLGITNVTLGATNFPNGDVTYFDNTATVVNLAQGLSSNVQISFATGYTYDTNIWIDFNNDLDFNDPGELVQTGIASTATNPTTLDASFTMPASATLGQHRMRIGTADSGQVPPDPCYSGSYGVTLDFTVNVIVAPTDLPDYANLQYPYTATITQGGSVTVYGRVYEGGLTDTTTGQAPGINAWVGYSTTDANPNTFTNWVPATFNVETDGGNNDEYQANIGSTLAPGTYYYATRFQLNGGAYVYGGTNYGFWNGTDKINGVLTVTPPPPPANDDCTGAIALTPGGVFADNTVTGTVFNATDDAVVTPSCAFLNEQNSDVWYSVVVPASGNITVETQAASSNSLGDTVVGVYSGTCGALTEIDCNDDNPAGGLFSIVSLTGQTPGATLYVGVWKWGTTAPSATVNQFSVSAYDASLGNSSFNNANFTFYPNPVKSILNLSYNQEISSVDLFNLLGQKVSTNKFNVNNAQVDMSNLSSGAYMVKITANDQVKTIKVIKE